jgi:hypothetical protein
LTTSFAVVNNSYFPPELTGSGIDHVIIVFRLVVQTVSPFLRVSATILDVPSLESHGRTNNLPASTADVPVPIPPVWIFSGMYRHSDFPFMSKAKNPSAAK